VAEVEASPTPDAELQPEAAESRAAPVATAEAEPPAEAGAAPDATADLSSVSSSVLSSVLSSVAAPAAEEEAAPAAEEEAAPAAKEGEDLDLPDLFVESSDLEAVEHSIAHQVVGHLEEARGLMSKGEHDRALEILDELYRRYPDDESLRKLLAEAELAFRDVAYRHYLPANRIPVLALPLDEIESQNLSPSEFFLLSRIDGTWDVKSIIQITPLREIEALLTLKRLREKGLIDLREAGD
jgi:hypothetical protein